MIGFPDVMYWSRDSVSFFPPVILHFPAPPVHLCRGHSHHPYLCRNFPSLTSTPAHSLSGAKKPSLNRETSIKEHRRLGREDIRVHARIFSEMEIARSEEAEGGNDERGRPKIKHRRGQRKNEGV